MSLKALVLAGLAAFCSAQGDSSKFTPLRPPALPLAVKSPYLSTYQFAGSNQGNGGYLPGQWPQFWAGQITGWTGYIRVDNITYIWMGNPVVPDNTNYFVNQTAFEYTSDTSVFTFNVANQVQLTATFLSPVIPESLLDMSLPVSYLDVAVKTLDSKTHDVQLYTDISAEWVSGDRSAVAEWSYGTTSADVSPNAQAVNAAVQPATPSSGPLTTYGTVTSFKVGSAPPHTATPVQVTSKAVKPSPVASPPVSAAKNSTLKPVINAKAGGVAYHKVYKQTPFEFTENSNQAEWGNWYYATGNTADLTYQQGIDTYVRTQFINNGFLSDTQDDNFRAIDDNYPVFGFAHNFGSIGKSTQQNATFQISLNQQNCIYFEEAAGNTSVPCLWTNYFDTDQDAVGYFFGQQSKIASSSKSFSNKVHSDASAIDSNYAKMAAIAVRQAFGSLEYTNTPSKPWIFLKEISSDGDTQTVDVIFPFMPIIVYSNPKLLRYILEPLFINQEAGYWPYMFSIHDLGPFPNATGYNNIYVNVEQQPVEECGNMLIMSLAYAQRTNDNDWLAEHYSLLDQWNQYLVNDSLIPADQLSTDDFLGAVQNDTNLAVKGIIGIEAMAQIANRTGHTAEGKNYSAIAHSYIKKWEGYGINFNANPPHEETQYGNTTTWDILYNIYGDKLLGLDLVPEQIYTIQSNFYPDQFMRYGVPLRNTDQDYATKIDWETWAASISAQSTYSQWYELITSFIDQTPIGYPLTDLYDAQNGEQTVYAMGASFVNRPVVGGLFAPLALLSAPTTSTVTPISNIAETGSS